MDITNRIPAVDTESPQVDIDWLFDRVQDLFLHPRRVWQDIKAEKVYN